MTYFIINQSLHPFFRYFRFPVHSYFKVRYDRETFSSRKYCCYIVIDLMRSVEVNTRHTPSLRRPTLPRTGNLEPFRLME